MIASAVRRTTPLSELNPANKDKYLKHCEKCGDWLIQMPSGIYSHISAAATLACLNKISYHPNSIPVIKVGGSRSVKHPYSKPNKFKTSKPKRKVKTNKAKSYVKSN